MRIRHLLHIKLWGVPLYIVCLCGLVGMAVDVDRPLAYWLEIPDGRFLHIPLLAGAVSIILYCCARAGGLFIGMVLKKTEEESKMKYTITDTSSETITIIPGEQRFSLKQEFKGRLPAELSDYKVIILNREEVRKLIPIAEKWLK